MIEHKLNFCLTWSICCLGVTALISAYVTFAENLGSKSDADQSHVKLITTEEQVDVEENLAVVREVIKETEESVDSFVYQHSVAPATPQLLSVTSSSQTFGSIHISSVSPSVSTDVIMTDIILQEFSNDKMLEKGFVNHDQNIHPSENVIKNSNSFQIDAVDLMEYSSSISSEHSDVSNEAIHETSINKSEKVHDKSIDVTPDSEFLLPQQDVPPIRERLIPFDKEPSTLSPTVPTPTDPTEQKDVQNVPSESAPSQDLPKDSEKEEQIEKKSDKVMLSFTEWKQKLDEESKEQSEVEDIVNVSKLVSQKNKTILNKVNKIRKNYASLECGAKVVSANAEASNSFALLKEDKDIYMLNPCNVKAWFVVELCERIELDSIDFANFEMFSSTPEEFAVYVSSRFPTREWEMAKTFTGKPEKKIHNYEFEERFYAKYLKIEVKKYFGTEHYCPLSLLRVYGITEVEQIEDEENPENSNEQDASNQDDYSADTNENIFTTARKAVVGLVSDMAKKLSGNSDDHKDHKDHVKRTEASEKQEIISLLPENVTHSFTETDFITKCIQRTIMSKFNVSVNPVFDVWFDYVFKKQMCATYNITRHHLFVACVQKKFQQSNTSVFSNNIDSNIVPNQKVKSSVSVSKSIVNSVSPIAKPPLSSDVSKLEDKSVHAENEKSDLLNIKKTEESEESNKEIAVTHKDEQATTCGKEQPTIDIRRYLRPSFIIDVTTPIENALSLDSTSLGLLVSDQSSRSEKVSTPSTFEKHQTTDIIQTTDKTASGIIAEKVFKNISSTDKSNVNETSNMKAFSENVTKPAEDVTKFFSNEGNGDLNTFEGTQKSTIISIERSVFESTPILSGKYTSVMSESENLIEVSSIISTSVSIITWQSSTEVLPNKNSSVQVDMSKMDEMQSANIDGFSNETTANTELPSSTFATIKTITGLSGSKESIIVKLNAKVKALHANLTMSMMYLQEMSERYRTAVEEVDKRHERKIFALNVSLKVQQDLIAHQSSRIYNLTKRVQELHLQLENLTQATQAQDQKLSEAQVSWIFVEIIAFIFILLFCRRSPYKENVPISKTIDNGLYKETKHQSQDHDLRAKCQPNVETVGNGHVYEISATSGTAKKNKRKKSRAVITHTDCMQVTEKRTGILFSAGNKVLSGITDALYGNKEKPSRQADALIDDVSKKNLGVLRRVKSIDPEPSREGFGSLRNFKDYERVVANGNPKSCDTEFVLPCRSSHKKHRNKLHKPVVGRFS